MNTIVQDIDDVIIHQLKLHWQTVEDLTVHVAKKIIPKYPDAEINVPGIKKRLESLKEESKVEQTEFCNRQVWRISGENTTIPNRVWNIISSLTNLECHIESIIHTIRKEFSFITIAQINNAIGILQSEKIIQVNNNIASFTPTEKQFIIMEVQS